MKKTKAYCIEQLQLKPNEKYHHDTRGVLVDSQGHDVYEHAENWLFRYYANITSAEKRFIKQAVQVNDLTAGLPRLQTESDGEAPYVYATYSYCDDHLPYLRFIYKQSQWYHNKKTQWLQSWAKRLGWNHAVEVEFHNMPETKGF